METKVCLECKETKPVTEFHKGSNGAKFNPRCKPCRSKQQAEYYKADWFRKYTVGKRSECKRRHLPFDLTETHLKEIWTGYCPVFGQPLVKHDRKNPFCPALDRLNPKLRYVIGNVVWISSRANRIKYDATLEELKSIVSWLEGATTIPKGSTLK